jgi:hypothetical protein
MVVPVSMGHSPFRPARERVGLLFPAMRVVGRLPGSDHGNDF